MEIRQLEAMDEMEEAEETMRSAFDASDTAVIPDHLFKICSEVGIVLGAYENDQQVGIAIGIRGIEDETVYIHAIGVEEKFQSQGIGESLMRKFLKISKDKGMNKVSLTYDPLLAGNTALYLGKAGGKVSEYRRNMYGDHNEGVNVGETPTDRLIVEYDLNSKVVEDFISGNLEKSDYSDLEDVLVFDGLNIVLDQSAVEETEEGFEMRSFPEKGNLGVQIPDDLSLLKENGGETEARYATREVLEKLFSKCYTIGDFISGSVGEGKDQNEYVLGNPEN